MNNIIGIPIDEELAKSLGKKGSENSITFYNRSIGENVLIFLCASDLKTKFYALPEILSLSDIVVLSTKELGKTFGETIIGCALLKKPVIFTDDNDISAILNSVNGLKYSIVAKENLLENITNALTSMPKEPQGPMTIIDIDKSFEVRGVGTVLLGFVREGSVKVHSVLYGKDNKEVIIRSIQSQDKDISEAGPGTRVGLAVKSAKPDEFEKGDVLSSAYIAPIKNATFKILTSPFAKEEIREGKVYGVANRFSYSEARISKNGDSYILSLAKALQLKSGDVLLLSRDESPKIFAAAIIDEVLH
ncbi:MAG: hypothetical protein ACP5RP_02620 [Candidatus Micrarchaeia archaeon]